MKYFYFLVLMFLISCQKISFTPNSESILTSNAGKKPDVIKAPDLRILGDESWSSIRHGALYSVEAYWMDINEDDYLNEAYQIKTGHRLILETYCPVVNDPIIPNSKPRTKCLDYSLIINKQIECVWDEVHYEWHCPSMLSVITTKSGVEVGRIVKDSYNFLCECRDGSAICFKGCDSLFDRNKFMYMPPPSIDFYYLYTDITDLIPLNGTSDIVITPTINFERRWVEQNYDNNSLNIPITLLPEAPYAVFTN